MVVKVRSLWLVSSYSYDTVKVEQLTLAELFKGVEALSDKRVK